MSFRKVRQPRSGTFVISQFISELTVKSQTSNLDLTFFIFRMSKAVCITGVLLMLHAAISIAHLRSIVRSRGETETRLPFDILLEVRYFNPPALKLQVTLKLISVRNWLCCCFVRRDQNVWRLSGNLTRGRFLLRYSTDLIEAIYQYSKKKQGRVSKKTNLET